MLCACATLPQIPAAPGERITVEFHNGPFCGRCDTLTIVANSDGRAIWKHGYWQSDYKDWVEDIYPLKMDVTSFRVFSQALDAYRPQGTKWLRVSGDASANRSCEIEMTDAPERRIIWESATAKDQLWVDLGCDPERNAKLFEFIDGIPALAGIKPPFKTSNWVASTRTR